MPLHVARLRDSDQAAEVAPEACWYAVLLWAASWHQIPAASLPDNDAVLTRLLGLGRDVRTFRKHKEGAMRGFVLCDDGRLYHPVVAEQAVSAWNSKLQQRWRTECARIKKQNQRNGTDLPSPTFAEFTGSDVPDPGPEIVPEDKDDCPQGQGIQERGTGTGRLEEEPPIPPNGGAIDPIFDQAWAAYPAAGRATIGKAKALTAWAAAVATGQAADVLLAAVRAYAAGDYAKSGGKPRRFDRWLADGGYEAFLTTPAASNDAVWRGPADLREALVAKMGETWTHSYLDACEWDEDAMTIIAPRDFTVTQLERNVRRQLADSQVQQVRVKGRAA